MKTNIIALSLFTLWALSTLSFGGVAPFYLPLHFLISLLFLPYALANHKTLEEYQTFFVFISLLCFFGLFQVLPLPLALLKLISPYSYSWKVVPLLDLSILPKAAYAISLKPSAGLHALSQLSAFTLILASGCILYSKSTKVFSKLLLAIQFFTSFLAFFSILARLSKPTHIFWLIHKSHISFGPFINQNHAGILFSVVFALSLRHVFKKIPNSKKLLYALSSFILFLAVLYSGSRTAVLCGSISIFIYSLRHFKQSLTPRLFIGAVTLLGLFSYFALNAPIWNRFLFTSPQEFTNHRIDFFKYALHIFSSSPWTGIGYGAFGKISPFFAAQTLWIHPEHVENDYLEILACGGIAVFSLSFSFICICLKKAFKNISSYSRSSSEFGSSSALFSFLIAIFFVFALPLPSFHILFAFLILPFVRHFSFFNFKSRILPSPRSLIILISLIGIFGFVMEHYSKPSDNLFQSNANISAKRVFAHKSTAKLHEKIRNHPMDAYSFYELSSLLAFQKEEKSSLSAFSYAQKLAPFDLANQIFSTHQIGAFLSPKKGSELIRNILRKPSLPPLLSQQLHIQQALFHIKAGQTIQAKQSLKQSPKSPSLRWKNSLVQFFIHPDQSSLLLQSWNQASKTHALIWDQTFLSISQWLGKDPNFYKRCLSILGPKKPDITKLMNSIARVNPTYNISWSFIPKKINPLRSSPSFTFTIIENTIEAKLINYSAETQGLIIPLSIISSPSLHLKISMESQQNISNGIFIQTMGQNIPCDTLKSQQTQRKWETLCSIDDLLSPEQIKQHAPIEGIGVFLPSHSNFYTIHSIEVFIK